MILSLVDASANNAVIDCIARATPLLVNPHPAVIEYFGADYPTYNESSTTWHYFAAAFESGDIYQSLSA